MGMELPAYEHFVGNATMHRCGQYSEYLPSELTRLVAIA
jgi:hypothetical protein